MQATSTSIKNLECVKKILLSIFSALDSKSIFVEYVLFVFVPKHFRGRTRKNPGRNEERFGEHGEQLLSREDHDRLQVSLSFGSGKHWTLIGLIEGEKKRRKISEF
ncbi:hypothetical protein STEG23_014786 [Scotinomys teguina]